MPPREAEMNSMVYLQREEEEEEEEEGRRKKEKRTEEEEEKAKHIFQDQVISISILSENLCAKI